MQKIHEIYYIAGLLEGEGCFGFYDCPVIQIHMTDPEPVYKARNIMAPHARVRVQNRGLRYKNGARKPMYILHFSGQIAIEWMMTFYTLMSSRRKEQIINVISKWRQMPNHKLALYYNREQRKIS